MFYPLPKQTHIIYVYMLILFSLVDDRNMEIGDVQ